ncbi:MAG: hypothetical protein K0S33_992 [Bacteroidetes bacterium]|jgi:hypothetical protein|nr:hypothetical protein [Bacteroidota bacterium]
MNTADKVYTIYFEETMNIVVMEWAGYATSEQFREGTELMLRTLVQHTCSKVLADIRDMAIIGMEDQKWLETDFLPRATAAGFKAIAIITPNAYFNKVAVESVSYKVDKEKLTITFFDNQRGAREFLQSL